ncbi:hypothetical protein B0H67DRAFT_162505 [Lasiosphaeris hirsuta]|uniref:Uncharacterized protein n=1 Tax=Lasiosphaeris hirsuta TaxID=260670 RepID=A0AA40DZW6_9PEZI|nr:hypothetical protein B0H67DRAFT_162505 [Lasiosphaeris hirsuta]
MSTCVVREVAWRAPACGLPPAARRAGRTPLCEGHLCRFRSPTSGRPCLEVPLRLVYSVRDSGGLLPDDTESFFCADHDGFACRATIEDGTRCPDARRSGMDYCGRHAESVCRARTSRTGACRSVAMEGVEYCEQHRCANGVGGRGPEGHCRNHRVGTGSFCDDHICIWKDKDGRRCTGQSPHKRACCAKHTCPRCEFGAEDDTSYCIYHLCAWGRRGKKKEYPPCVEPVGELEHCGRHAKERKHEVGALRLSASTRRSSRSEARRPSFGGASYERQTAVFAAPSGSSYDDETVYFSDPERPPISKVAKTRRSDSSRLMKRIEYKGAAEEKRAELDAWNPSWAYSQALRPWRPWTPH